MKRRDFLGSCALLSAVAPLVHADAAADSVAVRRYARSLLVDEHGAAIRAAALAAETNYVFHYPFASTPCFLLRLADAVPQAAALRRERGDPYAAPAGVGPARTIVSFSAICAHKLAYPTREVSFIRYQPKRSATSDAQVIHCCADHSVYDPASGARVLAGPAPQPLAAILLEHDAATGELAALGTVGAEQFDAFFRKYEFKLAMEHGPAKARNGIGPTSVVRELTQYCKQTIQC